ncbi:PAS domain S-box protein [Arcobacter sp. YIC-310]|uniref:PAS domain-containing protein n=1 Tax=Arcobacter sp. YIC-310 TaxID=3376632 RepID=UPI003C245C20
MNKFLLLFLLPFFTLNGATKELLNTFETNSDVMLLIDPKNGKIVKANKAASNLYGYSINKLKKMNIKDINTFTKEQISKEMHLAKIENRNFFIFNHKLASGKIIKVVVHSYPIKYKNKKLLFSIIHKQLPSQSIKEFNQRLEEQVQIQIKQIKENEENLITIFLISTILFIIGIIFLFYLLKQRDLLTKKLLKTNKELNELNQRFELAMNSTKDGLWDWDLKTDYIYYSPTWKNMFGYKEHEIKNSIKEWEIRVHPEDKEQALIDIKEHLENKTKFYENIHRIKHKDGRWLWIYDRGKAIFDKDGKPIRFIGFQTDLTTQKKIEKRIEEQKEEFKAIFENSMDPIAILDKNADLIKFNKSFLKITGYKNEDLVEKSYYDLIVEDEIEKMKEILNIVLNQGQVENIEKRCITKNLEQITVSMSITLMPDKKRFLINMKDISKQKLIETQSKLISMGEMIGNISHQWRQPLTIISTVASALVVKKECGILEDSDIKESSNTIVSQTKYLSQTIDDFRTFIKDAEPKEDLSLIKAINKTISLVTPSLKNNYITLIKNIEDDISIPGYENQLVQAFVNIINNAKDALKENLNDTEDKLIFISTKKIDSKLIITIKDNGGGISKDIISRIFEPYFTTKHQSVGTGIGLSLANDIISKNHKAKIEVLNEKYEYKGKEYTGAVFNIEFK